MKTIMVVALDKRRAEAPEAQKILTEFGCIIKTRLGIHDGVMDKCTDQGLIILELVGTDEEKKQLGQRLENLPGTRVKVVDI
ncbi:MAG TPA: hypothetical protein PLU24_03895 [Candidatus Omnitrophota bacterium]|nr:hypothetical protein [Candidatus Omnitrophota bacterium]